MILVSVWTNTPYRAGTPVCSIILLRFSRARTLIREQNVPCPSFFYVSILGTIDNNGPEMESEIYELICQILRQNDSLIEIAIKQRARFEGWLKFELANELKKSYDDTRVEKQVNRKLVDVFANNSLIELKTPNTNYKIPGVDKTKSRRITKNIDEINYDIDKLSTNKIGFASGYIAFVLFPVDCTDYQKHINCVVSHLGKGSPVCQGHVIINQFKTYVFVAKVF